MIESIHISNYALIDALDITFGKGFNIITGETGAGKSIILGALGLLLGGRADLKVVRDDKRKSVIEAVFEVSDAPELSAVLSANNLDGSLDGTVILRRELLPGGRSRAFVNDTPVNLAVLREVALNLVDIHSQHQNLLLASPEYQLDIIDTLAGNGPVLEEYRTVYAAYRTALKDYTDTRDLIRRSLADADYIAFQHEELAAMHLVPGEDESLERERQLLENLGDIKEKVQGAIEPLSEGQVNSLALIQKSVRALENMAGNAGDDSDIDFHALAERLESARLEIADIAGTLAAYDSRMEADPGRLEEVEARLSRIYSLQAKHHVETVGALIELENRLGAQLTALTDSDAVLARLETAARKAKKAAVAVATRLSEARESTAREFARELRESASKLGMANLRCDITVTRGKLTPNGFDQLQYLFAFNKNQPLMPVSGVASGGEISRLMLSIKAIVAGKMHLPSIIFDEIDTGVSGDIAARMARMMKHISETIQVIAITHLPGVAALGNRHFKVFKTDTEDATTTRVQELDAASRRREIALMLSGTPDDDTALAAADTLLAKGAAPAT